MNQILKTILGITPIKITFFVIVIALVLFLSDIEFLRLMELKTLDLRMVSRGPIAPAAKPSSLPLTKKAFPNWDAGPGLGQ